MGQDNADAVLHEEPTNEGELAVPQDVEVQEVVRDATKDLDSVDELVTIANTVGEIHDTLSGDDVVIDQNTAQALGVAVEQMRARAGLPAKKVFALEMFGEGPLSREWARRTALEDLRETMKAIFDRVIAFLKSIAEKLQLFFKDVALRFSGTEARSNLLIERIGKLSSTADAKSATINDARLATFFSKKGQAMEPELISKTMSYELGMLEHLALVAATQTLKEVTKMAEQHALFDNAEHMEEQISRLWQTFANHFLQKCDFVELSNEKDRGQDLWLRECPFGGRRFLVTKVGYADGDKIRELRWESDTQDVQEVESLETPSIPVLEKLVLDVNKRYRESITKTMGMVKRSYSFTASITRLVSLNHKLENLGNDPNNVRRALTFQSDAARFFSTMIRDLLQYQLAQFNHALALGQATLKQYE